MYFKTKSYVRHFNLLKKFYSAFIQRPDRVETSFHQKFARVCILGGDTTTGEATAFLLKQNPVVSQLYLHGSAEVLAIAADLRHFDTRCEVKAYSGKDGFPKALRRADIVLLIGEDKSPMDVSLETKLRTEAERVVDLANVCTKYAPKSIIVVCAAPVSGTLPLVTAVFKKTSWYHPGRIIGSSALCQVRANSLVASYQGLDPISVQVPLIGGPDTDCVIPLFSRASPVSLIPYDCEVLHEKIRQIDELVPVKSSSPCKIGVCRLSEAYAINQLVTTIGIGLCGDDRAVCTAFVRQNFLKNCRYLVSSVKFGVGGVIHNFGLPKLTSLELRLFEKATLEIDKREKLALELLKVIEKSPHKNVLAAKPLGNYSGIQVPSKRD